MKKKEGENDYIVRIKVYKYRTKVVNFSTDECDVEKVAIEFFQESGKIPLGIYKGGFASEENLIFGNHIVNIDNVRQSFKPYQHKPF